MAYNVRERRRPDLALNAIRLVVPEVPLPAVVLAYDRDVLHGFLDRPEQDVFAVRYGEGMVVVPLSPTASMPGERQALRAGENLRLVATLAGEAVFRQLLQRTEQGYRVTRRRPPTVVAVKPDNVIPEGLGLPDWLKRRLVLEFETRVLEPRNGQPYVVLTCSKRLRTFIGLDCGQLRELGVPLLGAAGRGAERASLPRTHARAPTSAASSRPSRKAGPSAFSRAFRRPRPTGTRGRRHSTCCTARLDG